MPAPLCSVTSAATAHNRPLSCPVRLCWRSKVRIAIKRSVAMVCTRETSSGELHANGDQCHRGSPTNVATLNEDWIQRFSHPTLGLLESLIRRNMTHADAVQPSR